jgi:hypothetical protein
MGFRLLPLFLILGVLPGCTGATHTEVASILPPPTYSELVTDVFNVNCAGCHVGGAASGGLQLDVYASISLRVIAADPTNSVLYQRMNAIGGSIMPPGGALSAGDLEKVSDWIVDGGQNN